MTRVVREGLAAKGVGRVSGFRWRGGEISRLEGFSGAVFAFAVTGHGMIFGARRRRLEAAA
jgi:hypothetical protein